MAGDRVSESYHGEISDRAMLKNKTRIDWFANSAKGQKVLDVGCSQGITPILIGRRGINVLAIDNDHESIDYANNALSKEEKSVQEKVTFLCEDFLNLDIEEKFDTVILGEVMEHLFNPSLFLSKLSKLLNDNGTILVSVPFGINPFWDHKRTYYFSDFYKAVTEYFNVESYKFFMGTIAFVAKSKKNPDFTPIEFSQELLSSVENAFFEQDTDLHNRIDDINAKLTQSYNYTKKLKELNGELVEKSTKLNKDKNEISSKLDKTVREKDRIINALEVENQENIKAKTVEIERLNQEKSEEIERLNQEKSEEIEKLNQEKSKEIQKLNQEKNNEIDDLTLAKNTEILRLKGEMQKHQEMINTLISSQEKSKKKIEKFSKELNYTKNRYLNLEKTYNNLCKSKFGKLQRFIWKKISNIKKKTYRLKLEIKSKLRKSKFLCKIVKEYRDKKENKLETFQENILPQTTQSVVTTQVKTSNAQTRRQAFVDASDKTFLERVKPFLEQIPESNGGRYYKKNTTKIGIICDEFLLHSLKEASDFTFINPDNWQEEVIKQDILMVVSAWKGMDEEWRGLANDKAEKRHLAYEIIEFAKENNVKTVFYSKEDPPNYDIYIELAKKCEYIFTSCLEVIENYKKDCQNDNVFLLPFGINPTYHNPIGTRGNNKQSGVIFSGSWMEKYPERTEAMAEMFDGIISANKSLKIIDRNYSYTRSEAYRFPEKYWKYISKEVDHETLQKIHKLYDWAININTVTDSFSMFANRAYELQACGNIIISNYSKGVNSRLPMVYTIVDGKEVSLILNAYDDESTYEKQMHGVRSVMSGETCFDRIGGMLETLGFESEKDTNSVLVLVPEITEKIKEQFDNQTFKNKELCLVSNFDENIKNNHSMIAFWDINFDYSPFYLEDMINGFKYTKCDYITKDAYKNDGQLIDGVEHDYVNKIKNKACTIFWSNEFSVEKLLEITDDFELLNGYSIDHLNVNSINAEVKIQEPKLSVIVPIYNNGKHLIGKAFSSLYRSTMFKDMEIILVDDGSTDEYTPKVVKYLEETYSNVKTYMFEKGGSGSASRPRNKGITLATAEHIVFLDPDDEIIFNGYKTMYETIVEKKSDVVFANRLKVVDKVADMKYITSIVKKYKQDYVLNDGINFVKSQNLVPIGIQSMIIRKDFLIENEINQVEGAAGEDSLFSLQIMTKANRIDTVDIPMYLYYAAVEGSVVNSIAPKFFEKYKLIEKPKRDFLEKNNLIEDYMDLRFNYYFENWTLKHLSNAKDAQKLECAKLAYEIFEFYKDVYNKDSKIINNFVEKCRNDDFDSAFLVVKDRFK